MSGGWVVVTGYDSSQGYIVAVGGRRLCIEGEERKGLTEQK